MYVSLGTLSADVEANPEKVAAVGNYPLSTNLSELRSFFLDWLISWDSFRMQWAVKQSRYDYYWRKGNVYSFVYTYMLSNHTKAFEEVKKALCSPPILAYFDSILSLVLLSDVSRLKGLGLGN